MINESLDAALFSDAGLDRSFQYGEQRLLVVGVADDVREGGPDSEPEPSLYLPLGSEVFYNPILLWSSSAGEVHIRNELERVAHEVHPHITIENFGSFRRFLHEATAPRRFRALIGGVLAGVSLLVSVGGAWGVSRFLMIKRGREVGIRLALGARPRSVERHLLSDTATSVAFGALGGLILALWLIPFIAASLPEFAPLSGATDYIFAVAAVTLPVLAAAWSVARKIARHAVSVALRTE